MTRRLVVALMATVLATLLVAGGVTLVLARWQARETTEDRLRDQAESLAGVSALAAAEDAGPREQRITRRVLRELRAGLRVDGIEFAVVGPAGRLSGPLPEGVGADDLDVAALQAGETVSGAAGSTVYAAAPSRVGGSTVVAVVTATASAGLATATTWYLGAAVVTLVLGAVVAVALGRRLARPVREADEVARRLAAGDVSARLPQPAATDGDELADLARSINTMADGLERARTHDRQFLLSVSHDLRTPLTSIRGYAEAIADVATPVPADAARVILAESARLERLVADLLELARLDGGAFSLHCVDHDARGPVGDAVRAFAPTAARAGLGVVARDGPDAWLTADPDRLRQVLGNLLENAAKYARSSIEVSVAAVDGTGTITVDDDGPGIAADDLPHIFERLYASRRRPLRADVGTGLGLAIVRQLVEAMGGTVVAGASPAGGARVEVRLPLAPQPTSART